MTDIFSDDDDFDAFRERLFDGIHEEKDEEFVPMFGLYALQRNPSSKPKPREDIFIRALEAPSSNDLDPYKDVIFEHKKPEFKAENFCENFSFFGMNQNRFRMEAPRPSREEQIAERNKLLEKARRMREEKEEQEDEEEEQDYSDEEEQENVKPRTPKSIPNKKKQVDTPRPVLRKRTRRIVVSSDEEDSDSDVEFPRSPRKKKASPDFS